MFTYKIVAILHQQSRRLEIRNPRKQLEFEITVFSGSDVLVRFEHNDYIIHGCVPRG